VAFAAGPVATLGAGGINPCLLQPGSCASLTVKPRGDGNGQVATTKTLGGALDDRIICGWSANATSGDCYEQYWVGAGKALSVYIVKTPADDSKVCSITHVCFTTARVDEITLEAGQAVVLGDLDSIDFEYRNPVHLSVGKTGTGSGGIESDPAGILCGTKCERDFGAGDDMFLVIQLAPNSILRGWSVGPCRGQGTSCHFTMPTTNVTILAELIDTTPTLPPPPTPITTPKPTPKATPKATTAATAGPSAAATAAAATPVATPGASGTAASPGASAPSSTSVAPSDAGGVGSGGPGGASGPTPAASSAPTSPAGDSGGGSGFVLLAIAIIVAGGLVGLGFAYGRRRRT
jgi:hypothetical protein